MYETFEHTADIGLRIRAADLDGLFAEAARAMFSVLAGDLESVRPRLEESFSLEPDEPDELLRRWLAELLYTFHVRRLVFCEFQASVGPDGLKGVARGEPIDFQRHEMGVEIKAVTWHGLRVEQGREGWLAEVIVDV